ncbi:unnamed protein product [Peronospora belbahrii]|uniref:Uncharacterized protein n=1 Tax=Peronospora belbahrii TaxID=622444 RepID=A0ABN8CVH0_9STRA|nr:unnamed protein product [Peronospora belbahrii]
MRSEGRVTNRCKAERSSVTGTERVTVEFPNSSNTLITLPVRYSFELCAKFVRCALENQANPADVGLLLILRLSCMSGLSDKQWPSRSPSQLGMYRVRRCLSLRVIVVIFWRTRQTP